MGLDVTCLETVAMALKKLEPKAFTALTLGRQGIHISYPECQYVFARQGLYFPPTCWESYCEKLLTHFGAEKVDSVDASPYEGCTKIFDLNKPCDIGKYDFILDGGTIEHIFNVPQVLDNIISSLNVGGIFCSVTTNNNFSGHGFYQFSPELFFRSFTEEYGMKIEQCYLAEVNTTSDSWIPLGCMDENKQRNETSFKGDKPVYILTIARKIADKNISRLTEKYPQQFNYEAGDWKETA